MFYVFSFPPTVYVGTLNLIASIPGPSILTLDIRLTKDLVELMEDAKAYLLP